MLTGDISVVNYGFEGKVALVTGSGSGIGHASAMAFAAQGATVAVADVKHENGERTVEAIKASGGEASFFPVDVASEASVNQLIADVVERFGALDFAHNNAGIDAEPVPLAELSAEKWRRIIDINLSGVFYCMKAEITHMLSLRRGAIVNTASASGLIGGYKHADYTAAKHGVIGLTKAGALDYATEGIRINAICPGLVNTAFVDQMPQHFINRLLFGTPMTTVSKSSAISATNTSNELPAVVEAAKRRQPVVGSHEPDTTSEKYCDAN